MVTMQSVSSTGQQADVIQLLTVQYSRLLNKARNRTKCTPISTHQMVLELCRV